MEAIYLSSSSFSVVGDRTNELITNRRVKLDCGVDGIKFASILSSSFDIITTVIIDEAVLTSNLIDVLYSIVRPGEDGNLANHFHSIVEGDGGYIPSVTTFIELEDTPPTYSGSEKYYLRTTTTSGIEFIDGIILRSSNNSEWLVCVTNSGTLYTEAI